MNIGILTNLLRDRGGEVTKQIFDYLNGKKDVSLFLCDELKTLGIEGELLSRAALAEKSDVIIVLGGDGTIIRALRDFAAFGKPVFTLNVGHKGFLASGDYRAEESKKCLDKVAAGDFAVDKRVMLNVSCGDKSYLAVNEAVVARGASTKMVRYELIIDGAHVDKFASDGVIISTPSGSTAYNLSAGGPMLAPDLPAIVITSVCPHSLHSKPMVVPDTARIEIKLIKTDPDANLSIDGEDLVNMTDGDTITVVKARETANFVRLKDYNYYENIIEKLRYWAAFYKE